MAGLVFGGLITGRPSVSVDELRNLPGITDIGGLGEHTLGDAVRVGELVRLAEPLPEAKWCSVISADGAYSASIPLDQLVEGGWLAFRLGGSALPAEAGGPLRLTVAQGKTMCWNVKNVGELRFTRTKEPDSLPAKLTH